MDKFARFGRNCFGAHWKLSVFPWVNSIEIDPLLVISKKMLSNTDLQEANKTNLWLTGQILNYVLIRKCRDKIKRAKVNKDREGKMNCFQKRSNNWSRMAGAVGKNMTSFM